MSVLASSKFWIATGERAVKSGAQAAVATLTVDTVGILDVDPVGFASVVGLMVAVSVATSLASIPVRGGPSLAGEALKPAKRKPTHRADV